MFEQCWQDLRLAWRRLSRTRGFTAAAVLTLASGIAGTTAMFALVEGVLLRPLPVRAQKQLLVIRRELPSTGASHWPFRAPEIAVLRDASRTLESVAGVGYNGASQLVAIEKGAASYIGSVPVTGTFFQVVGVDPRLGRALNPADDVTGADRVLVISHGAWQRRYGGARDVIGRRLVVSERPFTIVGVMPADFDYPRGAEAWMTIAAMTSVVANPTFRDAVANEVDVIARLRAGATIEQAASELRGLAPQIEADAPPGATRGLIPVVRSYEDVIVGDMRTAMLVLFGAVGLVLLIASANVANLLLMRGEARRPELAVRAALGASRGRLARQLLAESVVLALAAGVVGLAVTWWTLQAVVGLVPDGMPRVDAVRIDAGVVVFSIAIAFLTAALAGLAPALLSASVDLVSQLRSGGRGASGNGARQGRRVLVVAQVAIAVTIVAAAGLLTRSLLRLEAVDTGLATDRLMFVSLSFPQARYADRTRQLQFLGDVTARLEAAPEIAAATPVNVTPFSGQGWDVPTFTVEGQSGARSATNPSLTLEAIYPNYFRTFGVTLVRGRAFTETDRQDAPPVAIVSEDVALRSWPGEDPLGKRLKMGGPASSDTWLTIVGVVRPTRYRELRQPRPALYVPAEQLIVSAQALVLRTPAPLAVATGVIRERVRAVDPDVEVMRVAPFAQLLDAPLARPRFNAFLIGLFGIAAMLLAAVGLYAVMAAYVRQRSMEIGVRIALGATAANVQGLVIGEGLRLAVLGAGIGLATAVAVTRVLSGLLFDVHPLDPAAMAAAVLLLVGVSALASYLPARRATRLDPIVALRAN
jgi:predicted permease